MLAWQSVLLTIVNYFVTIRLPPLRQGFEEGGSMEHDMRVYAALGQRILELRRAQRMTQDQLAAKVGLTRTSITNIEGGKQKLLLHTLYDIAGALGVEPMEMMPMQRELKVDVRLKKSDLEVLPHEQEWIEALLVDVR